MKHLLSIIFILIFSLASGQSTPAIKIYLEDAETGKNICDAKVTLEGFEIPAITGKYDKKGKYYYFKEIPKGYNTIMSYHKKYNEKGFQNVNKLPDKLHFKLYNSINVKYDFEADSDYFIYNNFYIEDPYKVAIKYSDKILFNELLELLKHKINDYDLGIELVNPYYERDKIEFNNLEFQESGYPLDSDISESEYKGKYCLPLENGLSTFNAFNNEKQEICLIYRKRDGKKFKRFNDPIINKIRKIDKGIFHVYGIVINKRGDEKYEYEVNRSNFKIRDDLNRKFNSANKIDSSKIFFYNSNFRNVHKNFEFKNILKTQYYVIPPKHFIAEPFNGNINKQFILISKEKKIPINLINSDFTSKEIGFFEESIGLGILDLYEFYSK